MHGAMYFVVFFSVYVYEQFWFVFFFLGLFVYSLCAPLILIDMLCECVEFLALASWY